MKQRIQTAKRRNNTRRVAAMVGVAGLVWAATMTGCLGYSNYPQEDGVTWVNARDTASIREPMAKALAHIIELDIADQTNMELPGDGPLVAVNVPGGIAPESYRWIADKAGGGAGGRATPLSETVSGLPIYHIGAVRIRSNGVRVDVLRPITGLERDVANPVYVGVEVWMKGATGVRQIDHIRWREVGTMTVPALYTIEDIERAFNPEPEPEVESGG